MTASQFVAIASAKFILNSKSIFVYLSEPVAYCFGVDANSGEVDSPGIIDLCTEVIHGTAYF
jgi:hypothetical protein